MSIRLGPLVCFFLFCSMGASAQDANTKTLLVDRPLGDDPIRVVKVMDGSTELQSDGREFPNKYGWETAFEAGDEWLKDLSFSIKNVSKKKIVYVQVSCALYETSDWQVEMAKHSVPANPGLE
jgi:hypothetical protein